MCKLARRINQKTKLEAGTYVENDENLSPDYRALPILFA